MDVAAVIHPAGHEQSLGLVDAEHDPVPAPARDPKPPNSSWSGLLTLQGSRAIEP
jgi:hypothetical protein